MLLPAVLAVWVVTVGCATEQVTRWTPSPRVQWGDISPGDIGTVDQGYRLLLSERTEGLFPASLGVTRFAFVPSDCIEPFGPKLVADPQNEFLQWNYAFDDQMAVSEVFPIAQQNLGGANASADQILRSVHALNGGLGLIYAVNELSETETEMLGVLYDATAAAPLASVHARAITIRREEGDEAEDEGGMWETDSRALVRQKFQRQMHACVRDLILQDQPAPVESPDGWTPVGPIMPVEWPPALLKRLR